MRIFVTGATGFIGRNLCEALAADGHSVVATGRNEAVGGEMKDRGISFRLADIRNGTDLLAASCPVDVVIHCAGMAGDKGREDAFRSVNILGTANVLSACSEHGITRLIFMSTPSVYFTGTDRLGVLEDDPLPVKQKSAYGRTKLQAEKAIVSARSRGLSSIILRPRGVYGPHDSTILPRILRLAEGRRFPLVSGGRAQTDITYIDNLVDAVRLSLMAGPDVWNRTYNIANGEPITVHDWFESLLRELNRPFRPRYIPRSVATALGFAAEVAALLPFGPAAPPITRFSAGYMGTSMTLSIQRAKDYLGYSPAVNNEEGFRRTGRWWSQERLGELLLDGPPPAS